MSPWTNKGKNTWYLVAPSKVTLVFELLSRPGADCAGGGSGMSRQATTQLTSITKTCLYHHILLDFGISQVMLKFETSNLVKLGYLILNMVNDNQRQPYLYLWLIQGYPSDFPCEMGYRRLAWLKQTYTSLSFFQRRKVTGWYKSG